MPENGIARPVTDDEAAELGPVVADLLRTVPETWGEFDRAEMTAAQDRALYLLTAAGMVERRMRFRVSMATAPTSLEAVLTATGEHGFGEAMRPLLAKAWALWGSLYEAWNAGAARENPPFVVESVPPREWRLTECGSIARRDIEAGDVRPLDFVLWRGFFDGRSRPSSDGRIVGRVQVAGHGSLDSLSERVNGPELPRVNVANWGEGADVLAGQLAPALSEMMADYFKAQTRTAVGVGPNGGPVGFLGGAELCEALGIHPTRRDPFLKQLERLRLTIVIAGDCREVREPPPNTPTYLYRLNAPTVVDVAKAYREPKAG